MKTQKFLIITLIAAVALGIPLVCVLRGCPTAAASGQTRPDQKTVFFDNESDMQTTAE